MGIMDKIKSRDINFGSVEDKKDEVKGQETSLAKTNTSTIVQRDLDTSGILKVQTNLDLLNIDFDFLDEYVDEETKNKIMNSKHPKLMEAMKELERLYKGMK